MTTQTVAAAKQTGPERAAKIKGKLQQFLAFGGLIAIFVFFSFANPSFLTFSNFTSILFSTVVIGTLAIGATFVIITAGIDLSLGTAMSLCAVMAGVFIVNWHLPLLVGVVLAVLFGMLIGFINGINIAYLRIPPFIATLAMMLVAQGLALVVSKSTPIYFDKVPGMATISTGNLIPGVKFPNAVIILIVVALLSAVVLHKTVLGRYTYSIGSNEEATALSGINVRKWLLLIYTFAGLFTGLAGVLISARLGSAQPALGAGYELQAIAAVVIGGTSLFGGKGTILGTIIGALIMSVLNNGLQVISVPQEWQNVILGVVILIAVYTDNIRRKGGGT
jgi:ribose transport system permease protein